MNSLSLRTGALACAAFSILLFSAGSASAKGHASTSSHTSSGSNASTNSHTSTPSNSSTKGHTPATNNAPSNKVKVTYRGSSVVHYGPGWVRVPTHYVRGVLIPAHWAMAPNTSAPRTITITEQAQMETLANGDVSGFANATKGSHYTFVSVQGSQLVLQDAQGKQYLIDQSSTDYVAP